MRRASGFIFGFLFLGLLAEGCVQVQGDEAGVRVFNIYQGVESSAKTTGTYFYIPGLFDFYFFPKTQQKLEMVESEIAPAAPAAAAKKEAVFAQKGLELELSRVEEQMRQIQQIQVVPHKLAEGRQNVRLKTADGNDIWADVTVTYQIIEQLAPVLVQKVGVSMTEVERLVGMESRGVIRQVFGELETRDFYQAKEREAKIESAQDLLNKKLNPLGIRINNLTINQFRFLPEYEDLLRARALADQKQQEFAELTLAAQKEKEAKVAKAKGDAEAMKALAQGRSESLKLEGEAELYARRQEASATEAKLSKEAEGLRTLVQGLAGQGGDNLVARETARMLSGKRLIMIPGESGNINIMNLNDLLKDLGYLKLAEKPEQKTDASSSPGNK